MTANTTSDAVVKPGVFNALVKTSAIKRATVRASNEGLHVVVRTKQNELKILGAARGGKRIFKSIDGAASVLQKAGIIDFDCEIENWTPATVMRGYRAPTVRQIENVT